MEIIDVEKIKNMYGTPFYILDIKKYRENVLAFKTAFLNKYPHLTVGYSFKTNYIPQLCIEALSLGFKAEVVSRFEYDLAVKLGYPQHDIIFNGPVKSENDIFYALENHSIVNIDSFQELNSVISFKNKNKDKRVCVGIRVNIDLQSVCGNLALQNGLKQGRFGFSQSCLGGVVSELKNNDIIINSIHGHTSSSNRVPNNYVIICNQLLSVCKAYNLNEIEYFNVGGGFFGAAAAGIDITNKPTYEDYAEVITNILLNDEWFTRIKPKIVIEPGVSVVANVLSFISCIYEIKTLNDKTFVVIDGSIYDVKPSMHSNNLPYDIISSKRFNNNSEYSADVVGSTCMEKDIILSDVKLTCEVGDYIKINGIGAYSVVMTPTFINLQSPILKKIGDKYVLVRRRQTMADFLSNYQL